MAKTFSYLRAGKGYLCRQRFLPGALWRLYVKDGGSLFAAVRVPRGFWKHALAARLRPLLGREKGNRVDLPVAGDFCIPVHQGYKVFDLKRGSVFKLFSGKDVAAPFRNELVNTVRAGQLDFTPDVRGADEEAFWFEEEYVRGRIGHWLPGDDRDSLLVNRTGEFVACLAGIPAVANRGSISRERYTHQTARYIHGRCNTVRRIASEAADLIERWTEDCVVPIEGGSPSEMPLVFSHGDFSLKNIVLDDAGRIRVIDWEHAAPRSVYHDFCNLFVTEVYYRRVAGEAWFRDCVLEAAAGMESLLCEQGHPGDGLFGEHGRMLRHVYYLERMRMLLERKIDDNLIKVALRSMEAFGEFESFRPGRDRDPGQVRAKGQ